MEPEFVAVVTGGAQGIGKGIAMNLLGRGYKVALLDFDREAGEETQAELSHIGELCFVDADVSDENQVRRAIGEVTQRLGAPTALVNNAGIANPFNGPIEELSLEEWNRRIGVNLTGAFLCAKHCVPYLREHAGAIVNIGSTRAIQSEPHSEAYAAAKGGLVALTHALAISLGPEIRANCISPGWVDTRAWWKSELRDETRLDPADHSQHPSGRVGEPEDIASMTAYLLSDAAVFITGQNFIIDGGMTRKMMYRE